MRRRVSPWSPGTPTSDISPTIVACDWPCDLRGKRPDQVAQTARSASSFFVSAMALAGFRPLGQTWAQFMMVWQR